MLRLKRVIRLGIKSLWLHRLRSLLTVLGIVFGVCSVIAMLAIGEGASFEAQELIKNLGSQNIILRSIKPPEEQKVSDKGSQSYVLQYGLTYADIKRIQTTIPGVIVEVLTPDFQGQEMPLPANGLLALAHHGHGSNMLHMSTARRATSPANCPRSPL